MLRLCPSHRLLLSWLPGEWGTGQVPRHCLSTRGPASGLLLGLGPQRESIQEGSTAGVQP